MLGCFCCILKNTMASFLNARLFLLYLEKYDGFYFGCLPVFVVSWKIRWLLFWMLGRFCCILKNTIASTLAASLFLLYPEKYDGFFFECLAVIVVSWKIRWLLLWLLACFCCILKNTMASTLVASLFLLYLEKYDAFFFECLAVIVVSWKIRWLLLWMLACFCCILKNTMASFLNASLLFYLEKYDGFYFEC